VIVSSVVDKLRDQVIEEADAMITAVGGRR